MYPLPISWPQLLKTSQALLHIVSGHCPIWREAGNLQFSASVLVFIKAE
jgi:hypothetical protein